MKKKEQLPKFARELERRYPGIKVEAYLQREGDNHRACRTIGFTGPLEKLIGYGLAQKFGGRGQGNNLRYRGDGITEGVGSFNDAEAYIYHHLPLDSDTDPDVTKRAQATARQIVRRIQPNTRAGASK